MLLSIGRLHVHDQFNFFLVSDPHLGNSRAELQSRPVRGPGNTPRRLIDRHEWELTEIAMASVTAIR